MFTCWNAITDLRIAKNGTALAPGDPALKENSRIVSRNANRARVRLAVEQFPGHAGSEDEPRDSERYIINEPPGDELPRKLRGNLSWLNIPFSYWIPNGIQLRIPIHPNEMPRIPPGLRGPQGSSCGLRLGFDGRFGVLQSSSDVRLCIVLDHGCHRTIAFGWEGARPWMAGLFRLASRR